MALKALGRAVRSLWKSFGEPFIHGQFDEARFLFEK